jgi:hypothetical protein
MSSASSFVRAAALALVACTGHAQFGPSPYQEPPGLVRGAAFKDLILPIPIYNGLETNVWGGDNVKPRDADNGIEDSEWSYWCISGIQDASGKEHVFLCRWSEDSAKGHNEWPRSRLVRAVGDRPTGPFKVVQELGPGHNAAVYQARDGTYVVNVIDNSYQSKSLEGPWKPVKLQFDLRGAEEVNLSNCTFTRREDGSMLMVSRTGEVWVSEDGLKPYRRITRGSVYPRIRGRFEDPVVWRDAVQYHLIVNDWFGRTAYYLRSKDGVRWVWDDGKAYDPEVVRHPDGHIERWHKLERPMVRQDALGRATHLYMAAIDCPKDEDRASDNHSSKSLVMPLALGRRLALVDPAPITKDTREIQVEIQAEDGFDPLTEVDVSSLSFGAVREVNFGRGCKPKGSKRQGKHLVVTFDGAGHGLAAEDYAAKLLGRTKSGELLFGYVRVPGHTELQPLLLPQNPAITRRDATNYEAAVIVENLGQVKSQSARVDLELWVEGEPQKTYTANVGALAPYAGETVRFNIPADAVKPGVAHEAKVHVRAEGLPIETVRVRGVQVP